MPKSSIFLGTKLMAFNVNSDAAKKKLRLLKKNVSIAATETVLDASSFVMGKLKDQILNSPGTDAVGEVQPPHQVSQFRFVRRRTGLLVASVNIRPKGNGLLVGLNVSIAPYAGKVLWWSERRYGRNFLQLTISIYKKAVNRIVEKQIKRAIEDAFRGQKYVHQNEFPI